MAKVNIDIYVSAELDPAIPKWDIFLGRLDVGDEELLPLSLTFQCADAHDPTMKKGSHSQSFSIPASPHNNYIFKNLNNVLSGYVNESTVLYGLGLTLEFTRKQKFDCIISVNSNDSFWGSLQVKSVTNRNNESVSYECIFLSGSADWSETIAKKKLNDLYDNQQVNYFSGQRLKEGWTEMAFNALTQNNDDGKGHNWISTYTHYEDQVCYPLLSYGQPQFDNFLTVEDYKPCLFIRNMVYKIFRNIGYTVQSLFFETHYFRRLIYPLHDTRYGTEQLEHNKCEVTLVTDDTVNMPYADSYDELWIDNSATTTPNSTYAGGAPLKCNMTTLDPPNAYNNSNGHWVVPATGYYNIKADIVAKLVSSTAHYKGELVVTINLIPTGVYAGTPQANQLGPMQHNNTSYEYDPTEEDNTAEDREIVCKCEIEGCYLFAGDTVVIKAGLLHPGGDYPNVGQTATIGSGDDAQTITNTTTVRIAKGSSFTTSLLPVLAAHSYYNLKDFIPAKSQMEFFKGICHLFNLQIFTDSRLKTIQIEPFDKFYNFSADKGEELKIYEWQKKLDADADIKDTFIESINQTLVFDYKDDSKDAMLDAYKEGNIQGIGDSETNVGLGGYAEILGAGFPKGVTKYTNPHFAATFETEDTAFAGMTNNAFSAGGVTTGGNAALHKAPRIPCMWKEAGEIQYTYMPLRPPKSNSFEPRILYLQGFRQFRSPITQATGTDVASSLEGVKGFTYSSSGYQINTDIIGLPRACFSNINICIDTDFTAANTLTDTSDNAIFGSFFAGGILVGITNVNGVAKALVMSLNNVEGGTAGMQTWFSAKFSEGWFNGTEYDSPTSIFGLGNEPSGEPYVWHLPSPDDALIMANFYYSENNNNLEPQNQIGGGSGGYWVEMPVDSAEDLLSAGGAYFRTNFFPPNAEDSITTNFVGTEFGFNGLVRRTRYVKYIDLTDDLWTSFSAENNLTGSVDIPYTELYQRTFVKNDLVNLNFNDVEANDPISISVGSGQTSLVTKFTNKGLYNLFWRNMMEEMKTRPRLRSCKLYLDQNDITTLNLRRLVYLDGEYWRISKISGYQPNKEHTSTTVELIEYKQNVSLFEGNDNNS